VGFKAGFDRSGESEVDKSLSFGGIMKIFESRIFWGGILILAGFLFLVQNLGLFQVGSLFWIVLLALGGVFFLSIFFQNKLNWWALIPGLTLLSIGGVVLVNWLTPVSGDRWSATILLTGIGLSFALIYLVASQNWWAIIPAGVLFTLALIAGVQKYFPSLETAGLFFLGLGLTFALVAILPNPEGEMRWAWIPAGILLLLGAIFLVAGENMLDYVWPVILILAGGLFIVRALRNR
jgi:hypothetical protein